MKIISKMLVGALALAVTNVYAAELMTKAEFEKVESQYEKWVIFQPVRNVDRRCERGFDQKSG